MVMRKEITLGSLLGILVPLFVLILGWGISITSRVEKQDSQIESASQRVHQNEVKIEKVDDKIEDNFRVIQDKLDRILYQKLNEYK